MQYTVKEFSEIVGISIRAIRYYDEIGLLKPSFINKSGHRVYTDIEVNDLLLIVAFKEVGYNVNEICSFMQLSGGKRRERLYEVLDRLKKKKDELCILNEKISDRISKLSESRMQKY